MAVVGMGMHVGVGPWGGGVVGLMLNGPEHVLPIPTGGRDGRMEEKVIRRDGVAGEETDAQDMLWSRTQTG